MRFKINFVICIKYFSSIADAVRERYVAFSIFSAVIVGFMICFYAFEGNFQIPATSSVQFLIFIDSADIHSYISHNIFIVRNFKVIWSNLVFKKSYLSSLVSFTSFWWLIFKSFIEDLGLANNLHIMRFLQSSSVFSAPKRRKCSSIWWRICTIRIQL